MSQDPTADLRERYVRELIAGGFLHSSLWVESFRSVPRHEFLPRFFRSASTGTWEAIDEQHPERLALTYSNATWTTQLDGDNGRWQAALSAPVRGAATSSSSHPGLMAQMLETLDVHDGDAVLEIGTGTGYNAALLSHRLGSDLVATVDVDAELVVQATSVLQRCGYAPTTAVADGVEGYPAGAPYDRIIATCSVAAVPVSWITQTRSGGTILTSLYRDLGGGPMVRLQVGDEGATGRFLTFYGGFMPVRGRDVPHAQRQLSAARRSGATEACRPTLLAADVLDHPDFGMLAALKVEGVTWIGCEMPSGYQLWLLGTEGSWACLDSVDSVVRQHGPRRLWDELELVHDLWQRSGQPRRDRYGLSVGRDGFHSFWLDTPDNPLWDERS